jgi:multidrug resistance efflux pump
MALVMKTYLASAGRVLLTLIVVAAAVLVGRGLWNHYMNEPWTRDARVRADVIGVAPDVSGLVSEVLVRDNEVVRKGDLLFRVDRERFRIALDQAEAALAGRAAALDQAKRDLDRYQQLQEVISRKSREEAQTALAQAEADHRKAVSDRDLARLNLDRSGVKAATNGIVTNLDLQPGDYVTSGRAVVALVDTDSLHVEGYFEETKLSSIQIGAPVTIRLMGQAGLLRGRVASIAAAIEDRERTVGSGLLANINPTFTWVRLAQRVPVRIDVTEIPPGQRLIAGLTATVAIKPQGDFPAAAQAAQVGISPPPAVGKPAR